MADGILVTAAAIAVTGVLLGVARWAIPGETKQEQIYFTARGLPQPQSTQLTRLARDYAANVADEEWPLMRRGRTSPHARELVAQMRVTANSLRPTNIHDEVLMTQTLDAINALVDTRRERTAAIEPPVPAVLWTGLIVGAVITVGFTFF